MADGAKRGPRLAPKEPGSARAGAKSSAQGLLRVVKGAAQTDFRGNYPRYNLI